LPKLTHLSLGRRKVVRKQWLDEWVEANKITSDASDQHVSKNQKPFGNDKNLEVRR
jgi:hypothetical protein